MKRILLLLLALVVGLGLLAGAGFAGYRMGYKHGAQIATRSDTRSIEPGDRFRPGEHVGPGFGRGIDRRFQREFYPGGMHWSRGGRGFGFLPFRWLGSIALWLLIILLGLWVFSRSGWRLVRTPPAASGSEGTSTGSDRDQQDE